MRIRRAHCALTVVLAGAVLTLTGCSDSPAAVANSTQPTQPPADNGGSSDYCSVLEHSGDSFAKWQSAGSEGDKEREIIAKSFDKWLPAHCPDLDLKVEGPAS